jgi:hypothetical protein
MHLDIKNIKKKKKKKKDEEEEEKNIKKWIKSQR